VIINTRGERIFAEAVEETLKSHPSAFDSVTVGVPDDRLGKAELRMIELREDAGATEDEPLEHTKAHLAGFRTPKRRRFADTIERTLSGKIDYGRHRSEMLERVTST
jgi:acyl-CoA synthetase (AMP-forming)/AMP-acid ligase II